MRCVPAFGFPLGSERRWFAWHPVCTIDGGWTWFRYVFRRRYQTHNYLPGPTITRWAYWMDSHD